VSVSDRERPLVTGVNGPLMARRSLFTMSSAPIRRTSTRAAITSASCSWYVLAD